MSVREKVAEIITRYKATKCSTNLELEIEENKAIDSIFSLFPTSLSARELEKVCIEWRDANFLPPISMWGLSQALIGKCGGRSEDEN